jgi:hypothetical protein
MIIQIQYSPKKFAYTTTNGVITECSLESATADFSELEYVFTEIPEALSPEILAAATDNYHARDLIYAIDWNADDAFTISDFETNDPVTEFELDKKYILFIKKLKQFTATINYRFTSNGATVIKDSQQVTVNMDSHMSMFDITEPSGFYMSHLTIAAADDITPTTPTYFNYHGEYSRNAVVPIAITDNNYCCNTNLLVWLGRIIQTGTQPVFEATCYPENKAPHIVSIDFQHYINDSNTTSLYKQSDLEIYCTKTTDVNYFKDTNHVTSFNTYEASAQTKLRSWKFVNNGANLVYMDNSSNTQQFNSSGIPTNTVVYKVRPSKFLVSYTIFSDNDDDDTPRENGTKTVELTNKYNQIFNGIFSFSETVDGISKTVQSFLKEVYCDNDLMPSLDSVIDYESLFRNATPETSLSRMLKAIYATYLPVTVKMIMKNGWQRGKHLMYPAPVGVDMEDYKDIWTADPEVWSHTYEVVVPSKTEEQQSSLASILGINSNFLVQASSRIKYVTENADATFSNGNVTFKSSDVTDSSKPYQLTSENNRSWMRYAAGHSDDSKLTKPLSDFIGNNYSGAVEITVYGTPEPIKLLQLNNHIHSLIPAGGTIDNQITDHGLVTHTLYFYVYHDTSMSYGQIYNDFKTKWVTIPGNAYPYSALSLSAIYNNASEMSTSTNITNRRVEQEQYEWNFYYRDVYVQLYKLLEYKTITFAKRNDKILGLTNSNAAKQKVLDDYSLNIDDTKTSVHIPKPLIPYCTADKFDSGKIIFINERQDKPDGVTFQDWPGTIDLAGDVVPFACTTRNWNRGLNLNLGLNVKCKLIQDFTKNFAGTSNKSADLNLILTADKHIKLETTGKRYFVLAGTGAGGTGGSGNILWWDSNGGGGGGAGGYGVWICHIKDEVDLSSVFFTWSGGTTGSVKDGDNSANGDDGVDAVLTFFGNIKGVQKTLYTFRFYGGKGGKGYAKGGGAGGAKPLLTAGVGMTVTEVLSGAGHSGTNAGSNSVADQVAYDTTTVKFQAAFEHKLWLGYQLECLMGSGSIPMTGGLVGLPTTESSKYVANTEAINAILTDITEYRKYNIYQIIPGGGDTKNTNSGDDKYGGAGGASFFGMHTLARTASSDDENVIYGAGGSGGSRWTDARDSGDTNRGDTKRHFSGRPAGAAAFMIFC